LTISCGLWRTKRLQPQAFALDLYLLADLSQFGLFPAGDPRLLLLHLEVGVDLRRLLRRA
jgi:hypothetical protein